MSANLPTVGVVFAPRGAATLRDLFVASRERFRVVLLIPAGVASRDPALLHAARRLFADTVIVDPSGEVTLPTMDGVVTFHDDCLELLDRFRELTGDHRAFAASELADKLRQRARLRQAGLTRLVAVDAAGLRPQEAADAVGLPFVVKPRRGVGGRDVQVFRDFSERTAPFAEGLFAETYIPDGPDAAPIEAWLADYVSVETASTRERHAVVAVFGKLPVIEGDGSEGSLRTTGDVLPIGDSQLSQEIERLVTRALTAIGAADMVTHTEVKVGRDGPEIIEMNCRVGGHLPRLCRIVYGLDLIGTEMALAVGQRLPTPPGRTSTKAAVGVFVPFPTVTGAVRSRVSARDLQGTPGVSRVDEVAAAGDARSSTDGIAVNAVLVAEDLDELRERLGGFLVRVGTLFAADDVATTRWFRDLARRCREEAVAP